MTFFWQNPTAVTAVARGPSGRKIKYHVQVSKAGAREWEWVVSRDTGRGTKAVFGVRKTRGEAIKAAEERVGTF